MVPQLEKLPNCIVLSAALRHSWYLLFSGRYIFLCSLYSGDFVMRHFGQLFYNLGKRRGMRNEFFGSYLFRIGGFDGKTGPSYFLMEDMGVKLGTFSFFLHYIPAISFIKA